MVVFNRGTGIEDRGFGSLPVALRQVLNARSVHFSAALVDSNGHRS